MDAGEVYRRIWLMPDNDGRVDVGGENKRWSFRVSRSRRVDPRSRSRWGKKRNATSIYINTLGEFSNWFNAFNLPHCDKRHLCEFFNLYDSVFIASWCCAGKCDPCPDALSMLTYAIWCYYVLTCISPLDLCIFFSQSSSVSVIFYKLVCYIRSAQLEWWTTEEIIFTVDSGTAIPPVCHCDHHDESAAAITKGSILISLHQTIRECAKRASTQLETGDKTNNNVHKFD